MHAVNERNIMSRRVTRLTTSMLMLQKEESALSHSNPSFATFSSRQQILHNIHSIAAKFDALNQNHSFITRMSKFVDLRSHIWQHLLIREICNNKFNTKKNEHQAYHKWEISSLRANFATTFLPHSQPQKVSKIIFFCSFVQTVYQHEKLWHWTRGQKEENDFFRKPNSLR